MERGCILSIIAAGLVKANKLLRVNTMCMSLVSERRNYHAVCVLMVYRWGYLGVFGPVPVLPFN